MSDQPTVYMYSVQFSADGNNATWAYLPSIPNCRLNIDKGQKWTVFAFNIQPLATNFWPAQFSGIQWNTPNGQQPSFIKTYWPDPAATNNRMLLVLDENNSSSRGSYSFQLQVLYNGETYTAPDPIIVNKDTTGGSAPAVTSDVQEAVGVG